MLPEADTDEKKWKRAVNLILITTLFRLLDKLITTKDLSEFLHGEIS
jgi:hypothetical protein